MIPPYHDPDFTVPRHIELQNRNSVGFQSTIGTPRSAFRRVGFLLAAVFCVALMGGSALGTTTYFSQGSVDPTVTTNWNTVRGGGGSNPANFTSGDMFVIQNTHNMNNTTAWAVSGTGNKIQIENGGTLSAGALVSCTVFQIDNGGTYIVAFADGQNGAAADIPGSTAANRVFGASSTVEIQKWGDGTGTSPNPLPSGVSWGNLKINVATLGGSWQQGGNVTTINGNLSILATGGATRIFRLSSSQTITVTVGGDVVISGGSLDLSSTTGVVTFNVGGSYNQTGGTFTASGSVADSVNFTGTGKTFSQSAGTLTNTNINWAVNSGASLTLNSAFSVASSRSMTVTGTLATAAAITNSGTLSVNGTFQIDSGGSIAGTAPTYASTATLKYNSGGTFGRGLEWSATTGAGFPNDVLVSNNTTLDLGNGGASTARAIARDLTIDSGSTLTTAATAMTAALTVARSVLNNGTLTLSTSSGGDMNVAGNWTNNGTFTPNSRTVTFNGTSQTLAGSSTFSSLTINTTGSPNTVTASGSTLAVTGLLHVVAGIFTSATQYADVTIDSGATLSLSGDISVSGTWTNNGTFNANGFTVTFNGSSNQSIAGSQPTSFSGLNISNTAGVTLGVNTTVAGLLTLTGDIFTASFTVLMGTGSTSAGTGDVVGSVNRGDLNGGTTRSFGNPDVKVTVTAGTLNDMTITLFKGVTPNDFSNSVKRIYTITPNNGVNLVATVRLHYLDGELNGNSEATLDLWRKGVGWTDQLQTTRHDDTTGDQNYVELTGVSQFSDWTLANNSIIPTDVAMLNVKATRYNKRVLLEWQTGYEVNNVGFNIYREKNGSLERITPEPVAGSALFAGPGVLLASGFAYSWWDEGIADCGSRSPDCHNIRYWVEGIDLTGRTTTRGPFGVEEAPPDQPPPPGKGRAPLLSALGRDASGAGSSVPVERKATVIKPTAALVKAQAALASQTAVKLSVQREGWYRVEKADLQAAGFPAGADPNMLQLFVDGEQVPIVVTSADGRSWDGVEFYGIGIDSPSTANHVYWLVAGSQQGARVTNAGAPDGTPAPSTFTYTVERRDKVVYFPALKNGGGEKFFGPLILNAQPTDQSLVLQHVAAAGGNATLEVSVQGFTATPHSVRVLLNGTELGALQFDGLAKGTGQYAIAQSALREGSNQIQLISPAEFSDISMSEYVRLTYRHTNDADNNALRFPAAGSQQVTVKGFTDPNVRLIDVTIPGSPQELVGTVTNTGTGFSITANVPGTGARSLFAFASDQKKKPDAIAANQPSNWRDPSQASDYIVITRKDLIDSLGPLVAHRKSQGLRPAVVDIEDVYDEFSFGNKTPQAVKDFISYAKGNWARALRFVVLAGDATYDPKNYAGLGDFDLVPTKLVETAFNETATDDWFVDVNNDGLPDIPVGRLPVRTPDETAALVSKIVGYDGTVRTKSVLLFADRNSGFDFEAADTQLRSMIPAKVPVTEIRRQQVGDSDARSQLLDAINQGQRLVNYYGHGSTRLWTDAQILTAADAASFVNTGHLALFVSMTCLNGFFHDPAIESLGESLLKAQGGAVAVWASSGLTDPNAQVVMNQWAVGQLLGPLGTKSTIGEHIMRAKGMVSDVDVRRTWILLGDPATRLK